MKKLISILFLILTMSIVLAIPPTPTTIQGKLILNGKYPNGYHIEVKNLDNSQADLITSKESGSLVTESGKFFFDLSYFGVDAFGEPKYEGASRYYAGDRIQVSVVKDVYGNKFTCSKCSYTFNVPKSFPYIFEINVQDTSVEIIEKTCITEGCPTDSKCNVQTGVCEKETVTTETKIDTQTKTETKIEYICSDGTKVTNKDLCPIETKERADRIVKEIIIVGGTVALGFAGLYLYYRRKKQFSRAEKMADTYIKRRKK